MINLCRVFRRMTTPGTARHEVCPTTRLEMLWRRSICRLATLGYRRCTL